MSMSSHAAEPVLNATPLIDVLLVVLVILIITLPVMTHNVQVTLPHRGPDAPRPEIISIDVDFDGAVFWNGEPAGSDPAIERRLKALLARNPEARVDVRPDPRSAYESTARVLAATQRAHVTKLVIAQVPDR
jgi:biopolymer transport protein ExbD